MEKGEYVYDYPRPMVATDCVIFGFDGTKIQVLLVKRAESPYPASWGLPGGFIRMDESAEASAKRVLQSKTGMTGAYIEQFHTFSSPDRDVRDRVISIAYYALVRKQEVREGGNVVSADWFSMDELPDLCFDHKEVLDLALVKLRERIMFRPVGFDLLPEKFTMRELQSLYESILGVEFDRRNFSKKILHVGLLDDLNETIKANPKREAKLYKFNQENYDRLKEKGFRLEF
ncbi:MAG: NUDIX hydrolase [Paludibacteraceae bacterium]|nr:NUDIX hydrolase [Paludibacteraceae bacterium]